MADHSIIHAIHNAPLYGAFVVTGGASAVADLLAVPGASATVAEVTIPYTTAAMASYLGGRPEQACAPETARAMAMVAFQRALTLPQPTDYRPFGLGCTSALRTLQTKRGDHRVFVAAQTLDATHTWTLHLLKDARQRPEEERVAAALVIHALATIAELPLPPVPLLDGEVIHHTTAHGDPGWQRLILGQLTTIGHWDSPPAPRLGRRIIFPGAFNPYHRGHERMAHYAQERLGGEVEFEICVRNIDKPPLNYADIRERTGLFPANSRIWLTTAATFDLKAQEFPGATFLVGLDTIVRIAHPRYYQGDAARRDAAVTRIAKAGCRFLTFGRQMGDTFVLLGDVDLPPALRAICDQVSADQFRVDLSSTEVRARNRSS